MHPFEKSTAQDVIERQIAAEIVVNAHCRLIMADLNARLFPALQESLAQSNKKLQEQVT